MNPGTPHPQAQAGQDPKRTLREEVTNLPNMLTFARIVMIPPVMWLMLRGDPVSTFWACVIFGVAALTDFLDGYLARRQGLVSVLGKLLDPLADKMIVMASLVVATQIGHIPAWFVALLLSRELVVQGMRTIAGQEGLLIEVVRAGKTKTALQLTGLMALILHYPYDIDFLVVKVAVDFNALGIGLLSLSMLFSLGSAGVYTRRFFEAVSGSGTAGQEAG